ncbi:MAG: Asp-tRNA(Asn)/Glu-tRNA(Gln) amidotransferase subunit GatA, partial [Clostridia bacterium]|nr:Asp-tRNA(Asn)/Glu-tRNA(Gln) amidotransferase subunit GatA [Clostridia bacterium]
VAGLRIGIAKELLGPEISKSVKEAVLNAAAIFRGLGAETVSVSLPSLSYATEAYYIISSAEASSNLARYDGVRFGSRARSEADNIDNFYMSNRSEGFGDEVKRRIMLGTFVLSEGSYEDYYKKALGLRRLICEDYKRAFEKCDIILSPTAPTAAYPQSEELSDPTVAYAQDLCTVSQSLAGLPALSIPCARDERGLPIGMQLTGPAFSEELLYRAGVAFEEVAK